MYVYIQSEPSLWTVGHYNPQGKWIAESDHSSSEDAAARVAWLNGAASQKVVAEAIGHAINNHVSAYHAHEC